MESALICCCLESVIITTGICAISISSFFRSKNSLPSITGIITSSRIRSIWEAFFFTISKASLPSAASSILYSLSNIIRKIWRFILISSTIRIVSTLLSDERMAFRYLRSSRSISFWAVMSAIVAKITLRFPTERTYFRLISIHFSTPLSVVQQNSHLATRPDDATDSNAAKTAPRQDSSTAFWIPFPIWSRSL